MGGEWVARVVSVGKVGGEVGVAYVFVKMRGEEVG